MKAVLLAAGLGTRLGSLTQRTPKILVGVNGRTVLLRQLDYLRRQGVTEIAINVHHLASTVESYLSQTQPWVDLKVQTFHERRLLGTSGALTQMVDWIGQDLFMVLYGDVLTNAPAAQMYELHLRGKAIATVAYCTHESPVGEFELDAMGRVTGFTEKRIEHRNAGIYICSPGILEFIQPGYDFMRDTFPLATARGNEVDAFDVSGSRVIDIGTPLGLEEAKSVIRV